MSKLTQDQFICLFRHHLRRYVLREDGTAQVMLSRIDIHTCPFTGMKNQRYRDEVLNAQTGHTQCGTNWHRAQEYYIYHSSNRMCSRMRAVVRQVMHYGKRL